MCFNVSLNHYISKAYNVQSTTHGWSSQFCEQSVIQNNAGEFDLPVVMISKALGKAQADVTW